MLHLYPEPDADAALVATRLRRDLEGAADVVTRAEAVEAGLFGPVVRDEVLDRVGEIGPGFQAHDLTQARILLVRRALMEAQGGN